MRTLGIRALLLSSVFALLWAQDDLRERFARMSREWEQKGLAEKFVGVRTAKGVEAGLFALSSTGVSTEPVRKAAEAFLATLTPEQKAKTQFGVDDDEWRKWMNQHFYIRQGMGFKDMSEAQRAAAFGLMKASLSAKGLTLSRDIMKLNHTLGELNNDNFVEYGEWLYWITVMGTPSKTEPWGWQVDGHHLIVNYFVLGDQVVMSPAFFGSEPVRADAGKFKGTVILQEEQAKGLAFVNALSDEQRKKAILDSKKTGNNNVGEAFKDNVVLEYAGLAGAEMNAGQRETLIGLIGLYVSNMDDGHARVKMSEVKKHIDRTYFAWIGATDDKAVFYYRIHSPVILIEFDHQTPAGLRRMYPPGVPFREHVHVVVRTPNGNDYGKDLLRMHYAKHRH
ncbi:MAG: DUF3500 domain-containing protein [Bryobacteraceae bacterium]|nr:DUF3500 domain-containing protein [Bryobacteraceae bacterium]